MRGLMLEWDAPTTYPIDLNRIKTALRISHDEFDAMIVDQLLPASLEWVEGATKRSVVARAHRWVTDHVPAPGDDPAPRENPGCRLDHLLHPTVPL